MADSEGNKDTDSYILPNNEDILKTAITKKVEDKMLEEKYEDDFDNSALNESELKSKITEKVEDEIENLKYKNDEFEEEILPENIVETTEENQNEAQPSESSSETTIFALVRSYKHNSALYEPKWKDYIALDKEAINDVKELIDRKTVNELLKIAIDNTKFTPKLINKYSSKEEFLKIIEDHKNKSYQDRIKLISLNKDITYTNINIQQQKNETEKNKLINNKNNIETEIKKLKETKIANILKLESLKTMQKLLEDIKLGYIPMIFYFEQTNDLTPSSFNLVNYNNIENIKKINSNTGIPESEMTSLNESMSKVFENFEDGRNIFTVNSISYKYTNQEKHPTDFVPFGIQTITNELYKNSIQKSIQTPTKGGNQSTRLYRPPQQRKTGYYNF